MCFKRYADAVPLLHEAAARAPNLRTITLWLAAAYVQLGQLADALAEAAEVMPIKPAFHNHRPSEDPRMRSISSTGWARRGLPER